MSNKIKVLIVDDSVVKIKLLEHILNSDDNIQVIGSAKNADDTLEFLKKEKPDVITMDIKMPGDVNGFELSKIILNKQFIPIIIISSINHNSHKKEIAESLLKSGAQFFIESPPGPWHDGFDIAAANIIRQVKMISRKKISKVNIIPIQNNSKEDKFHNDKLIVIGVSTGGPKTITDILTKLPASFSTPIVIVQHISKGFDKILAELLNKSCKINVTLCKNKETLKKKNVYFVPAEKITKISHRSFLTKTPPIDYAGYLPPISPLFDSVIGNYDKNKLVGIILTGMGADGAKELKKMRMNGAITIAQDKESSVVYGMPKVAAEINAAEFIMNPNEIAEYIIEFDKKSSKK